MLSLAGSDRFRVRHIRLPESPGWESEPESRNSPQPLHFNNENPTRALNTTSLKCCLPSTDALNRQEKNSRMRIKVEGRLRQARCIKIHQGFARKRSDTFLTDLVHLESDSLAQNM